MASRGVPRVLRRRLGELLRHLRVAAELSIEEAAGRLEWSSSKLYRIERATQGVSARDVRDMLDLYGVPEADRDEMLALVREARRRGWWQSYSDALPEPYAAYVGLEQDAKALSQYSAELVPGLLQTADYARAIRRAALLPDSDQTAERWLAVRNQRQSRLRGRDPLDCRVVLNEAVLRRPVGGAAAMRAQLRHLGEVAQLPNVSVVVLPFEVGAHAAMVGDFTIIHFAEQTASDMIYVENTASCLYLEDDQYVGRFTLIFNHVQAAALDQRRSLDVISEALDHYG